MAYTHKGSPGCLDNVPQKLTIHFLAAQGELSKLQENLKTSHPDVTDEDGMTLLMWAAFYKQENTVKYLLEINASVNLQDKTGQCVLTFAASQGHVNIVETLLKVPGCLADLCDNKGNTALMYAATAGHTDCVKVLLAAGAQILLKNKDEKNVYEIAVENHHEEVVNLIEQHLSNLLSQSFSK